MLTAQVASAPRVLPRDVVYTFSYITWAAAQRRGMAATEDRMVQTLLRHARVRRALVANPYRSAPISLVRDRDPDPAGGFPHGDGHRLLQPLRLRRADPVTVGGIRRSCARYEAALRRETAALGLHRPVVITANPLLAGFGDFSWAGAVTFYAIDDWTAYPAHRRWWRAYRASFEQLRQRPVRVCAISSTVLERLAPAGPGIVVPNGIEPAEWTGATPPPAWFAARPGPRLLYVGTLDDRLDVELLATLARARPEATIALVGPLLQPRHLAPLRRCENVVVHPAVDRATVTALVRAADACLLPHVRSRLTEGMSPLKLYEYLAGGRPVASVDLPPVHGIDPRVHVAPDGDFAAAVDRALASGPMPELVRQRFLTDNSWRRRHEDVIALAFG